VLTEAKETVNIIESIVKAFKSVKDSLPTEGNRKKVKLEAYELVEEAAMETKRYLYDLGHGGQVDRKQEKIISDNWKVAGDAIDKYDSALFKITRVKKMGWTDHKWDEIEKGVATINLDTIIGLCQSEINSLRL